VKKVKLLALISAVVTVFLLITFLTSLSKPSETPKTEVLVAAKTIPPNVPITQDMLTLTKLPSEAIISEAIADAGLVIGKVARTEILAGEQILTPKLVLAGESRETSLNYAVEPGMRAISIAVDAVSSLSFMITPGNHVDIIGQYEVETADNKRTQVAKVIAENLTVLAVDSVLSEAGKSGIEDAAYKTLTLQATPAQALKLSFSENAGVLRAVLRSPLDETITKLPSMTAEQILAN